jgi:hypothetical protein
MPLSDLVSKADESFSSYDFGDAYECGDACGWDTTDPADLTRIVYLEDRESPDADSFRVSFHVRFDDRGEVIEVYALDMASGGEVGSPGD